MERNRDAFRPKVAGSPHDAWDDREPREVLLVKLRKCCNCKKNGCLNKYCACFQAGVLCSENCKCINCKNFEGSEDRWNLLHGEHANTIAQLKQAANAAITRAIGAIKEKKGESPYLLVSENKRAHELYFMSSANDPSFQRLEHFQRVNPANHVRASLPSSSSSMSTVPVSHSGTATPRAASKVTYRSPLAGIIQEKDVRELCSVLVVTSEKQVEDQRGSSSEDSNKTQRLHYSDAKATNGDDSGSDGGAGAPDERPKSPGTLELMCDEQNTSFMAAVSPNERLGQWCRASSDYAEQERVILTKFRDCLNKLIAFGEMKESLARAESECQKGPPSNRSEISRTDTGDQRIPMNNGAAEKDFSSSAKTSLMTSTVVPGSNPQN